MELGDSGALWGGGGGAGALVLGQGLRCILLGGSWDLVSRVISTLTGVISSYKYSYHNSNPSY